MPVVLNRNTFSILVGGSNSSNYACGYSKGTYVHSIYVSVKTIGFHEGNKLFYLVVLNRKWLSKPGGSN